MSSHQPDLLLPPSTHTPICPASQTPARLAQRAHNCPGRKEPEASDPQPSSPPKCVKRPRQPHSPKAQPAPPLRAKARLGGHAPKETARSQAALPPPLHLRPRPRPSLPSPSRPRPLTAAPPRPAPTILPVEGDLHFAFLGAQQGLRDLRGGAALRAWPVQEVAGAGPLHHLGSRVAAQLAEAVVAVDDRAVLHPSVGDDELAAWGAG